MIPRHAATQKVRFNFPPRITMIGREAGLSRRSRIGQPPSPVSQSEHCRTDSNEASRVA
jgi:hypothetical protein